MVRSAAVLLAVLCSVAAHAATFTVTSSADSGPGTLRQAILDANATPGRDQILFQSNVTVTASLPPITEAVDVDGTSTGTGRHQVQFTPLLDGSTIFHFAAGSDTSTIRDLVLRGFTVIRVSAADVTVARNSIFQGNVLVAGATNATIGGPAGEGNVSLGMSLDIFGSQSTQVLNNRFPIIQVIGGSGNRIGSIGNGNSAGSIAITDSPGAVIEGNTVSGGGPGLVSISVRHVNPPGATIRSNLIQGASDYAILLRAPNALVENNTISGHPTGIAVLDDPIVGPIFTVTGVTITGNSMFDNGIDIDLHDDGPTPNDAAPDADTGGNNRQNFPVLTSAIATPDSIVIGGTLTSAPLTPYRIEIFSDTAASGEARTFLGAFDVTTDAAGNAAFFSTIAASLPAGHEIVTSTATNRAAVPTPGNGPNETSELSAPVVVVTPGELGFDPVTYTVNESDGTVTLTVVRTGGSDGTVTVDFTTANGTATAPDDYQTTAGMLTFGDGVTSQTIVVPIVNDVLTEPAEAFTVTLSDPTNGATLGAATATVTIVGSAAPAPIPTASTWALLALAIAIAAVAVVRTI